MRRGGLNNLTRYNDYWDGKARRKSSICIIFAASFSGNPKLNYNRHIYLENQDNLSHVENGFLKSKKYTGKIFINLRKPPPWAASFSHPKFSPVDSGRGPLKEAVQERTLHLNEGPSVLTSTGRSRPMCMVGHQPLWFWIVTRASVF